MKTCTCGEVTPLQIGAKEELLVSSSSVPLISFLDSKLGMQCTLM